MAGHPIGRPAQLPTAKRGAAETAVIGIARALGGVGAEGTEPFPAILQRRNPVSQQVKRVGRLGIEPRTRGLKEPPRLVPRWPPWSIAAGRVGCST